MPSLSSRSRTTAPNIEKLGESTTSDIAIGQVQFTITSESSSKLSLRQGSRYYPIAYGGTLTIPWGATVNGSNPATVAVPQSAFSAYTTGNLTTTPPPYLYFGTQASFYNQSGSFAKSGGFVTPFTQTVFGGSMSTTPLGTVMVSPGTNAFGGTLRLLGSLRRLTTRTTTTGSLVASQGLPLGNLGYGQLMTPATSTGTYGGTMTTARAGGARWTTGAVTVGTPTGYYVATSGYDNRSSLGLYGTLRLVTPHLVATGPPPQGAKPGFAVLELRFAPEPAAGIALAVGLLGLGLLWRFHRRSAPRR
jgi:hypothetical protein